MTLPYGSNYGHNWTVAVLFELQHIFFVLECGTIKTFDLWPCCSRKWRPNVKVWQKCIFQYREGRGDFSTKWNDSLIFGVSSGCRWLLRLPEWQMLVRASSQVMGPITEWRGGITLTSATRLMPLTANALSWQAGKRNHHKVGVSFIYQPL